MVLALQATGKDHAGLALEAQQKGYRNGINSCQEKYHLASQF